MNHYIFISYSNEAKSIAETVCSTLEQDVGKCWIAPRDVKPGVPYAKSIVSAIKASEIIVLIFTKKVNVSKHVRRELELALSEGKPIIPFRIEEVKPVEELEYYIRSIHWLDATSPPLVNHLPKLVETTRSILASKGVNLNF